MEDLARLVNESLADHGYQPKLDHRRLQWSKWFRCDSSFSVLLALCWRRANPVFSPWVKKSSLPEKQAASACWGSSI
jgi:hypothetical protein